MGCFGSRKLNKPEIVANPNPSAASRPPNAAHQPMEESKSASNAKQPSAYDLLGDRAPTPCSIGDAHGVAMAFMKPPELKVTKLPFRHPPLLDHEVRIRVVTSGLCHSDVMAANHSWMPVPGPLVAGHEFIGIVQLVGEKVTKVQEGDRVGVGPQGDSCATCVHCKGGQENYCLTRSFVYPPSFGGNATSWQGNARFVFKIPDALPSEAAPLLCAGITVFAPLFKYAQTGSRIGVTGVGGLGHLAIKYASKLGCEVTALSRTAAKEAEARQFGATRFVVTQDQAQVQEAQHSLDILLDTGTSVNIAANCSYLRPGGTLVMLGAPAANEDVGFQAFPMIFNSLSLKFSAIGSTFEYEKMLEFSAAHNVVPQVKMYPFADAQAGYNSLAYGKPSYPRYRNVLEMDSFMKKFTPAKN